MAEHVFTPQQLEAGIVTALAERELFIVPALLRLLERQDRLRANRLRRAYTDLVAGRQVRAPRRTPGYRYRTGPGR